MIQQSYTSWELRGGKVPLPLRVSHYVVFDIFCARVFIYWLKRKKINASISPSATRTCQNAIKMAKNT